MNIEGRGFVLGSYICKCKPGYYSKADDSNKRFCLKCSEGCDLCDGSFDFSHVKLLKK